MIVLQEVVDEVRLALDEYSLSDNLTQFDANLEDSASSNFSDEDIQDRSLDGARYIAARCTASSLQNLVDTINPTDSDALTPIGDGGVNATDYPFLRLLGSRVDYNGALADRRTFAGHLSAGGLAPTDAYPIYVFEDMEFLMSITSGDVSSEDPSATANVNAKVVKVPMFYDSDETTISTYDGVTWTSPSRIPLDDKFKAAIVYYVLSSCFQTKREVQLAAQYRKNMFDEVAPYLRPQFDINALTAATQADAEGR